jgi:hypothetical protein
MYFGKDLKNIRNLYERTLKIYKFQNSDYVLLFLAPKYSKIVPSELFYDEIRLTKFSFSHSESEFLWVVQFGLQISEFWASSFLLNKKLLGKQIFFYGEICWIKLNKLVILTDFPYETLMRSFVQEFHSRTNLREETNIFHIFIYSMYNDSKNQNFTKNLKNLKFDRFLRF